MWRGPPQAGSGGKELHEENTARQWALRSRTTLGATMPLCVFQEAVAILKRLPMPLRIPLDAQSPRPESDALPVVPCPQTPLPCFP